MPDQPTQAESDNATGHRAEDTHYYRGILHELIDMGADLARRVHRQAIAQPEPTIPANDPEPTSPPDPTQAFDRIARAIRRTIALARNLAEPVPSQAANPGQHRTATRKRIIREVEDAIQRRPPGPQTDADGLHAELRERLDGPDLDDDIDLRPIPEIIADICRDLGIAAQPGTHAWKRRTPQDIEALCARAAQTAITTAPTAARREPPLSLVPAGPARTGNDPPRPTHPRSTQSARAGEP